MHVAWISYGSSETFFGEGSWKLGQHTIPFLWVQSLDEQSNLHTPPPMMFVRAVVVPILGKMNLKASKINYNQGVKTHYGDSLLDTFGSNIIVHII